MKKKEISKVMSEIRKKGWKKVPKEERTKRMRELGKKRWIKKV